MISLFIIYLLTYLICAAWWGRIIVLVRREQTRPAHLVLSNSHLSFVVRTGRSLHHQEGALANGRGCSGRATTRGKGQREPSFGLSVWKRINLMRELPTMWGFELG